MAGEDVPFLINVMDAMDVMYGCNGYTTKENYQNYGGI
jgi:hypothetical protein